VVAVNADISRFNAVDIDLFDSVAQLQGSTMMGSGARLAGTNYILTSAHVAVTLERGDTATFMSDQGTSQHSIESAYVHPLYEGDLSTPEYDLALVGVSGSIPSWAPGYELYREPYIFDQQVYFAGYGDQGSFGGEPLSYQVAPKTWASNVTDFIPYNEDTQSYPDISPGDWDQEYVNAGLGWTDNADNLSVMDFDNGTTARNAIPYDDDSDRLAEFGLGQTEGIPLAGDSGGPILAEGPEGYRILGTITQGVSSYADPDWSSFGDYGELSVNAMPSAYSGWIDFVVNDGTQFDGHRVDAATFQFDGYNEYIGNPDTLQTLTIDVADYEAFTHVYHVDDTPVIDTRDQLARLQDIERVTFDLNGYESYLAFDTDGNAGQAYRLYQAAFARTPDQPGVRYWTWELDDGMPLEDVAEGFLSSEEFARTYGSDLSDRAFVEEIYENVLQRAPDDSGYDYWLGRLDEPGTTRADVLIGFSESPENKQLVGGAIADGIELGGQSVVA
jgi:hypothetical protein